MEDSPRIPSDKFFDALGKALPPKVKEIVTTGQGVTQFHVPVGKLSGQELKELWLDVIDSVQRVKNEAQEALASNEDDMLAREVHRASTDVLHALMSDDPNRLDALTNPAEALERASIAYLESKAIAQGQVEGKALAYMQGGAAVLVYAISKLSWLMGFVRQKLGSLTAPPES